MKKVNIYTATTFRGLKHQDGAIGYVLEYVTDSGKEVTKTETMKIRNSTPNFAEISVLNDALARLTMPCELTIYTESGYVKRGIENWLENWIANNWINGKGEEVANRIEWELLVDNLKPHKYSIEAGVLHKYRGWLMMQVKEAEKA